MLSFDCGHLNDDLDDELAPYNTTKLRADPQRRDLVDRLAPPLFSQLSNHLPEHSIVTRRARGTRRGNGDGV